MKSPFIISPDFLSPLLCERILNDIEVTQPDVDLNGNALKQSRHNLFWEQDILDRFRSIVPDIESRYDCDYRGLEKPVFQCYPENAKGPAEPPGCENSQYLRKRWVKTQDVDLVGIVWLKNFNSDVPLDQKTEVYGGKLEFPAYNFSLVPQRGTLVLFPAGPHFITVTSPVLVSSLYTIKLKVCIQPKEGGMWFYQPQNFAGKWEDWLAEYL